ncbi:MAG: dolichyl-phosphate beta-glucosyltransferase [Anaerolineales bacterium]
MHLSVIIPAYNEAQRLGPNLSPVLDFLARHYADSELIIVDDGSTDATAESVRRAIATEPRARLISYQPNHGKGYAVRTGVAASRGDLVLFMDADLATPLDEIPDILGVLADTQADIVIGSRGLPASAIAVKPPPFRRFASWVFDQIKYALVGLRGLADTQCGFKVFRGGIARQLFALGKVDRFMFDVEILFLAERAGLVIREMPVAWADQPGSKVRFLEGVISMFRDLWLIRRLHAGRAVIKSNSQVVK